MNFRLSSSVISFMTVCLILLRATLCANALSDTSRWRQVVKETLESSKSGNQKAIIVDKSSQKIYLVDGGKLKLSFACICGCNVDQQKMVEGDKVTPEGKYHITAISNSSGDHYKIMEINYPNNGDRARFAQAKALAKIPRDAKIGRQIQIQGGLKKSSDCTEGCVVLQNSDIDQLLQYVGIGTPVAIVRISDQWP